MNWDKPVPLVIGRGWPALWHIRALGREGIPVVHAWTPWNDPAMFSRYAKHVKLPRDRENARLVLSECAKKTKNGMFLLDRWPEYEFLMSPALQDDCPTSYWSLRDKARMMKACEDAGVPVPKTVIGRLPSFDFPWVIKPCVKTEQTIRLLGSGVRITHSDEETLDLVSKLGGRDFVIQEWIPGGPVNLVATMTCSDRHGHVIADFGIRKIRQYPPDVGTIVVGETYRNQEVINLTKLLLNSLGYVGLANTEFKLDERDGQLKLLEVNPRLGKSHGFAVMCGVNLPLIRYKDFVGEPVPEPSVWTDGVVWADLLWDVKNCFVSHREMYDVDWLGTFRNKRVLPAIWAKDDPLPALVHLKKVFWK